MKEDEKRFLVDIFKKCNRTLTPRDLINEPSFYIHYKRAWYLLSKWCDKGWYSFGVTLDLGWLEQKGIEEANKIISEGLD